MKRNYYHLVIINVHFRLFPNTNIEIGRDGPKQYGLPVLKVINNAVETRCAGPDKPDCLLSIKDPAHLGEKNRYTVNQERSPSLFQACGRGLCTGISQHCNQTSPCTGFSYTGTGYLHTTYDFHPMPV